MGRLHRYFLREIAAGSGLTFLVLFGISILAVLPRLIHQTMGASLLLIFTTALIWALDSIPDLLLISILVGSVFTYSRASADNEILAMRASGISLLCPLAPLVLAGLLASALAGHMVHTWIPVFHFMKHRVITDLAMQGVAAFSTARGRLELSSVTLVFDPARNPTMDRLSDVQLIVRSGQGDYNGRAEEIRFEHDPEAGRVRIVVRNFEGLMTEGGHRRYARVQEISLEKDLRELYGGRLREGGGDKDLRTSQLVAELLTEEEMAARSREGVLYTLHRRLVEAVAPLLMALVAFPIGVLLRRSGRMVAFAASFLPLALYYSVFILARRLASTTGEPWLAWMPAVALAAVVAPLLVKVLRI